MAPATTYVERIRNVIEIELQAESVNKQRLTENLLLIINQAHKDADEICRNLHALMGEESALTIPLGDGCTVKVHFAGTLTKRNLQAFVKIFETIAAEYFEESAR